MAPHWLHDGGHLGSIRVPRMRFGLGSSQIFSRIFKIPGRYIGVSKNKGTPKWMVYNFKTLLKWMIWGVPLFLETPICIVFNLFMYFFRLIYLSFIHLYIYTQISIDILIFIHTSDLLHGNVWDVLRPSNFDTSVQGERPWGETVTEPWGRIAAKWPWCFFVVGDGCQLVGPRPWMSNLILVDLVDVIFAWLI